MEISEKKDDDAMDGTCNPRSLLSRRSLLVTGRRAGRFAMVPPAAFQKDWAAKGGDQMRKEYEAQ